MTSFQILKVKRTFTASSSIPSVLPSAFCISLRFLLKYHFTRNSYPGHTLHGRILDRPNPETALFNVYFYSEYYSMRGVGETVSSPTWTVSFISSTTVIRFSVRIGSQNKTKHSSFLHCMFSCFQKHLQC